MHIKSLPQPSVEEARQSEHLQSLICADIAAAGGAVGFDRFMEMALYAPRLGYYAGGLEKFGAQGDFVTAPEISPLYGQALARQVAQILQHLDTPHVIEFGAGSGKLAVDLLTQLARAHALPDKYLIVELSAELRHRQQMTIRQSIPQHEALFEWVESLPTRQMEAVIVANEVLDAMPVQRFRQASDRLEEMMVSCHAGRPVMTWGPCSASIGDAIGELAISYTEGYQSEINLRLAPWIHTLSQLLSRGAILLIDYGYARRDYYHQDRVSGTLMCHYHHIAHGDALLWPGLQDITAHVDFTAVAEAAVANGLDVRGYTNQSSFLIGCGIDELLAISTNGDAIRGNFKQVEAVKRLMLPTEMGEIFKVMALTRDVAVPLRGFSFRDLTASL